jgi:heme/copper-type cytochrome/quinol oxidase subunit 2
MAFILAGIVLVLGLLLAIFSEMARGMATAPSMHKSSFLIILIWTVVIAALIALSHYIPHMSW